VGESFVAGNGLRKARRKQVKVTLSEKCLGGKASKIRSYIMTAPDVELIVSGVDPTARRALAIINDVPLPTTRRHQTNIRWLARRG
jgi:hypothetical protein